MSLHTSSDSDSPISIRSISPVSQVSLVWLDLVVTSTAEILSAQNLFSSKFPDIDAMQVDSSIISSLKNNGFADKRIIDLIEENHLKERFEALFWQVTFLEFVTITLKCQAFSNSDGISEHLDSMNPASLSNSLKNWTSIVTAIGVNQDFVMKYFNDANNNSNIAFLNLLDALEQIQSSPEIISKAS